MTRRAAARGRRDRGAADVGSAVVDFSLVAGLLTLLLAAVVQLAVVLHVRATVVDCASEGARLGALADRTPADGAARTRSLVAAALSPAYAQDVSASTTTVGGRQVVEVVVRTRLPVAGLVGVDDVLTARGHGLVVGSGSP